MSLVFRNGFDQLIILIGQTIDLALKEEKGKVLICNLGPTFAIWDSALLFAININKTHTSLSVELIV